MAARLTRGLRWRLSTLWILEWGITGTILTYLPIYLDEIQLSDSQQGQFFAVGAIGLWIAPFVVGQVTDRWMASEKYLAMSHLLGGLILLALAFATEHYQKSELSFTVLMLLMGLFAAAYFPTVPVATALSFRHLPDPDRQFGTVRIWGTVGWIISGFGLSLWLGRSDARQWLIENFSDSSTSIAYVESALGWLPEPSSSDCFRIAAILSFILSSFCIFLPPTPPARSRDGGLAPLQILGMFRNRSFTWLIGISLMLSLIVPLYTLQAPRLLVHLGFTGDWIPAVMLIGQISEFPALLFLPFFLKRLGLSRTFAIGIAAWFIRYTLFAFQGPNWLILFGLSLHGICHVFFIIVIQLYVDSACRPDLRVTAQNLFAFITLGIGMPIGFLLGGKLGELFFNEATQKTNYHAMFAVPAVIFLAVLIVYTKYIRLSIEPRANEQED